MFSIFGEVLSDPKVWVLMGVLFVLSWLMQRIINRMALLCQSVHVVHVPWGIMWTTLFAYLAGFLEYKQVIILACLYLAAYPGMWWLNYRFTQQLKEILKQKHITRETTGVLIWPSEIRWFWQIKRVWKRQFRSSLDEEIVNWIVDYHGRNGYSQRHGIPIKTISRDS